VASANGTWASRRRSGQSRCDVREGGASDRIRTGDIQDHNLAL
jgi:hypothetical protein